MNVRIKSKLDMSGFLRRLREVPDKLDMATAEVAQNIIDDIKGEWSPSSPSSPGSPPAVVSGELDASLKKRRQSGGVRVVYEIHMAEHGMYLEKGTRRMSRRPFVEPALARAKRSMKDKFKAVLK